MQHSSTLKSKNSVIILEIPRSISKIATENDEKEGGEKTQKSEIETTEKLHLKLNSPYILEACENLGLTIQQLKKKSLHIFGL